MSVEGELQFLRHIRKCQEKEAELDCAGSKMKHGGDLLARLELDCQQTSPFGRRGAPAPRLPFQPARDSRASLREN